MILAWASPFIIIGWKLLTICFIPHKDGDIETYILFLVTVIWSESNTD